MKRREFLISGMGALATGVAGCAGISQVIAPNWPNITPAEMNGFLVGLDGAMNSITENPEGGRFVSEFQQKSPSEKDARLFRQGMRSLLLAGNFGDLSVAGQVHPGVQKRLQYSAPEMDSAVIGTMDQMKSLPPTARADMQSAFREDATLGDRVLEAVDLEAAAVGASNRRRKQLHVMGNHIIGRLKHSSDMFINEYVTKCEKLTSVPGSVAETQRFMAARMGEAAFKAQVQKAENAARYWQRQELEDIPIGYQLVTNEEINNESLPDDSGRGQPQPQQLLKEEDMGEEVKGGEKRSDRLYRKGGRMLGIGAISTVVGLLIIGASGDSVDVFTMGAILGWTVGPIMILVGLVTLLVGSVARVNEGP
jgi:hypothetical protein